MLGLGDGAVGPLQPATRASLAEQMEAFERGLIVRELAVNNGDTRTAAEALEIPRKTLYDKLNRHSVDPRTYRGSESTVDQLRTAPLHLSSALASLGGAASTGRA